MRPSRTLSFVMRQIVIVVGAIVGYFGVRGLTEGNVATAERNAGWVLDVERWLGIAFERGLQESILASELVVNLANWVYIWMHWPVLVATLIWLIVVDREEYVELRNAMIISGVIGLFIFATFPVAPPRLLGLDYVDTVTERSHAYRVLQPPSFTNAYAAVPSLHFGWNLLVGLTWMRVGKSRGWRVAGVVMPAAMAWAVVATANHYVLDVIAGGSLALIGVWLERRRLLRRSRAEVDERPARLTWPGSNHQSVAPSRRHDTTPSTAVSPHGPSPPSTGPLSTGDRATERSVDVDSSVGSWSVARSPGCDVEWQVVADERGNGRIASDGPRWA